MGGGAAARHWLSAPLMHFSRDERVTFWGQKVKVQVHGRIECAINSALRAEAYSYYST